jgi:flagellar biogenesis protein FliO
MLPEVGVSVLRVGGALALVLVLFLSGVWLFRNWQRFATRRGQAPRLAVLETRSLGSRQALLVVGYDRHRLLLAASPAGVSLVAHLPESDAEEPADLRAPTASFAEALHHVLRRR